MTWAVNLATPERPPETTTGRCQREALAVSPAWCVKHAALFRRALATSAAALPAAAVAFVCLPLWASWSALVLFVLLEGVFLSVFAKQWLPLNLPPYAWRLQARHVCISLSAPRRVVHGDDVELVADDSELLFRCPGCGCDSAWPSDRTRYRCRRVEYEVRGMSLWFADCDVGRSGAFPLSRPGLRLVCGAASSEHAAPHTNGVPNDPETLDVLVEYRRLLSHPRSEI
ncbi:MAG: hypothetical protein JWN04_5939 [Myxococcaceae bacterium]|nr:hypothetical protein [Myxococcaceae bacterium]